MRREVSASRMPIGGAVYLPEQYPRLLATAEDASDLEPTWQEWYTVFQETRQKMAELGMDLIEVIVDLDALEKYCQEEDSKIRAAHEPSMSPTCCLNSIHDKSSGRR